MDVPVHPTGAVPRATPPALASDGMEFQFDHQIRQDLRQMVCR